MSILKLENVCYRYSDADKDDYVLKDISYEFDLNKMYAIKGKSGSGKTTLLSLISGLEKCEEGNIYFENKNLKNMDLLTNYTDLMIELENNLSAGFLFNELKSAVNNSINNSENSKTVIMYLLQEYLRLANIISNYEKNHIAVPNSLNYLCEILLVLLKEHKVFLIDVLKELDLDLPKL